MCFISSNIVWEDIKYVLEKSNFFRVTIEKWHTFNNFLQKIGKGNRYYYNQRYLYYNLKEVLFFILSFYEYSKFSRILVTQGLNKISYEKIFDIYKNISSDII